MKQRALTAGDSPPHAPPQPFDNDGGLLLHETVAPPPPRRTSKNHNATTPVAPNAWPGPCLQFLVEGRAAAGERLCHAKVVAGRRAELRHRWSPTAKGSRQVHTCRRVHGSCIGAYLDIGLLPHKYTTNIVIPMSISRLLCSDPKGV